jgi:hypothetical protein
MIEHLWALNCQQPLPSSQFPVHGARRLVFSDRNFYRSLASGGVEKVSRLSVSADRARWRRTPRALGSTGRDAWESDNDIGIVEERDNAQRGAAATSGRG